MKRIVKVVKKVRAKPKKVYKKIAKKVGEAMTYSVGGGMVANAVGGQYPTKPRKTRIKKAFKGE